MVIFSLIMLKASAEGDIDTVRSLIDQAKGFDLDFSLLNASLFGHIDIVKLILSKGERSHCYNTAMYNAASHGHIEIVRLMLNLGADNIQEIIHACEDPHLKKLLSKLFRQQSLLVKPLG